MITCICVITPCLIEKFKWYIKWIALSILLDSKQSTPNAVDLPSITRQANQSTPSLLESHHAEQFDCSLPMQCDTLNLESMEDNTQGVHTVLYPLKSLIYYRVTASGIPWSRKLCVRIGILLKANGVHTMVDGIRKFIFKYFSNS